MKLTIFSLLFPCLRKFYGRTTFEPAFRNVGGAGCESGDGPMILGDNLDTLSDDAINEVFAVEVQGLRDLRHSTRWEMTDPPDDPIVRVGFALDGAKLAVKRFSTDANAVLPWLEKCKRCGLWVQIKDHTNGLGCGVRDWLVIISGYDECCDDGPPPPNWIYREAADPTFARAACIALIRAKRASKQPAV